MNRYFQRNFNLLRLKREKLYEITKLHLEGPAAFKIIMTESGKPTMEANMAGRKLLIHSKYNPEEEARRFIEGKHIHSGDTAIIYGFGLGYHVREALKRIGVNGIIYVIEPNVNLFIEALRHVDLSTELNDKRLEIIMKEDINSLSREITNLLSRIPKDSTHIIIHRPSLELTPEWAIPLKEVLQEWQVKEDTVVRFSELLEQNLTQNIELIRDLPGVSRLFGRFNDVPILLIAAGPSLDEDIKRIGTISDKCITFTVGTALKPLLAHNIFPDLVIITDPHPIVFKQIEKVGCKTPGIFFPTVHPTVISQYPGLRSIAYQQGMDAVEQLGKLKGETLVETGGSVITAALDVSIRMGCNPIVLAGVDLAYTGGLTHARGTMHGDTKIESSVLLSDVISNAGTVLKAPTNLNIYRKWIERRIEKQLDSVSFYNLSREGARINGAQYIPWEEACQQVFQQEQEAPKKLILEICSAMGESYGLL